VLTLVVGAGQAKLMQRSVRQVAGFNQFVFCPYQDEADANRNDAAQCLLDEPTDTGR